MALLEIENLHVSYGSVEVLHGISLYVDEGEIVTLLGANGAGKSTTLLSISRLVNPREGRITFNGKNLLDYESYQVVGLGVAQSPEGRRVFGTMTVQENLMLGAFQVHSETIKQNTLEWIFQLFPRLLERRSQMAGTLSGGEQQMLSMGRALMDQPRLLLHTPHQRTGRDRPPCGAERPRCPEARKPRLRARGGQCGYGGHGKGTPGQSARAEGLSRRLASFSDDTKKGSAQAEPFLFPEKPELGKLLQKGVLDLVNGAFAIELDVLGLAFLGEFLVEVGGSEGAVHLVVVDVMTLRPDRRNGR